MTDESISEEQARLLEAGRYDLAKTTNFADYHRSKRLVSRGLINGYCRGTTRFYRATAKGRALLDKHAAKSE